MTIKELTLLSNDLVATEEFYTKKLQFRVVDKSATSISFSVGHSILSFKLAPDKNPCYHFAFSIPSNKVEESLSFMAERTNILHYTAESMVANFTNWNAHAFYF